MRHSTKINVVNTAAAVRCAVNGGIVVRNLRTHDFDCRAEGRARSLRHLCLYLRDGLAAISHAVLQAIGRKPAIIALAPVASGTGRGLPMGKQTMRPSQAPSRWRRSSRTRFSHR